MGRADPRSTDIRPVELEINQKMFVKERVAINKGEAS
jgi:hypothetical protein